MGVVTYVLGFAVGFLLGGSPEWGMAVGIMTHLLDIDTSWDSKG